MHPHIRIAPSHLLTILACASFAPNLVVGQYLNFSNSNEGTLVLAAPLAPFGTLFNNGLLTVTSSSIFENPLKNSGTINVQNGFLDLRGGYAELPGTNATLHFAPGTGLTFSKGVAYFFSPALDLENAVLQGGGTFNGQFQTRGPLLISQHFLISGTPDPKKSVPPAIADKVGSLVLPGSPGQWKGYLDLFGAALIVEPASNKPEVLDTLADQIVYARNAGWLGNGITSSIAYADRTHTITVSLFDNAALRFSSFGGQSMDDNSLLLTTALLGDANLDNHVDLADYDIWYAHIGNTVGTTARGDFNLDGLVDLADYDTWFRKVGASYPALTPQAAAPNLQPILPIPEPLSLLLLAPLLPSLLRRRTPRSFASA